MHTLKITLRRLLRESYRISQRKLRNFYEKVTEFLKADKFSLSIECFPIVLKCINIELPQKVSLMKSTFCIDLQRFMLIPTKFPLSLRKPYSCCCLEYALMIEGGIVIGWMVMTVR